MAVEKSTELIAHEGRYFPSTSSEFAQGKMKFATFLMLTTSALARPSKPVSSWPGWSGIEQMFVFGDSYTTTGFNATTGPQPSPGNPLGNPKYPGYTSSNGPNWVDYLTVKYYDSLVLTYNLAYGGATVDAALVAQYLPTVLSLKEQVQTEFLPLYGTQQLASWKPDATLFAIFVGINDVGNSYAGTASGNTTIYDAVLSEYTSLVNQLYDSGARNFVFLNVPPVDRSPLTASSGPAAQALEASRIALFNSRIATLAANLAHADKQNAVFLYDTHTLFEEVLDNPQQFPQTAPYRNTTDYCLDYENGTAAMDTLNASCVYPVNEYFWLNSLHPTYPMHDLLSSKVAEELRGGRCM
ncbi:hypothetical protein LTR46_001070 [Exophiala xenobiotica]|nr:hypothetical protein LTR46_001070 [Exophiala xenobiotica]